MTHIPHRLEVLDISVSYGEKPILRNVSFQVPHGARVAVVGPNGAGKSTLFKALVGLLPLRNGRILIHGEPLGAHRDCVAYVPQREAVDWRFPVTASDVVMMGRYSQIGWLKRATRNDRAIVQQALEQLGIGDLAGQSIGRLSGGQQQRVFLARALAQQPHILLMDEPFTGVDAVTQGATLRLLDALRDQGVTTIISTHDLNLAAGHFDHLLLLNRGVISFGHPTDVLTQENLSRTFGSSMLILESGAVLVDECCPPGETHTHTRGSE